MFSISIALLTPQTISDLCIRKNDLAEPHSQIWSKYLDNNVKEYSAQNCKILNGSTELQRRPLNFCISFSKIYILDFGLRGLV